MQKEMQQDITDIKITLTDMQGKLSNLVDQNGSVLRRLDLHDDRFTKQSDRLTNLEYDNKDLRKDMDELKSWKSSNKLQISELTDTNPKYSYTGIKELIIRIINNWNLVIGFLGIGSLGAILSLIISGITLYKMFNG